jgi:hypothetical protein
LFFLSRSDPFLFLWSLLGHYGAGPSGGFDDQGFLSRAISIGMPVSTPAMHHRW